MRFKMPEIKAPIAANSGDYDYWQRRDRVFWAYGCQS